MTCKRRNRWGERRNRSPLRRELQERNEIISKQQQGAELTEKVLDVNKRGKECAYARGRLEKGGKFKEINWRCNVGCAEGRVSIIRELKAASLRRAS